jgi:small-conductance mechanosensitive channel
MPENISQYITQGVYALIIALAGYFGALLLGRVIQRFLVRFMNAAWASLLGNLARLAILFLSVKFIVDVTGVVGAFVVIITALTGAFAIGSERLAADMVAGVKLVMLDYYKPGDIVTVAEYFGEVMEITVNNTILKTLSQDHIFIPNSTAIEGIITNHSRYPGYLVDVRIPVAGKHDRTQAMKLMQETAIQFEPLDKSVEPRVLLDDFGYDTTYYQVIISVPECTYDLTTAARLRLSLVEALNAQDITVGEAA